MKTIEQLVENGYGQLAVDLAVEYIKGETELTYADICNKLDIDFDTARELIRRVNS